MKPLPTWTHVSIRPEEQVAMVNNLFARLRVGAGPAPWQLNMAELPLRSPKGARIELSADEARLLKEFSLYGQYLDLDALHSRFGDARRVRGHGAGLGASDPESHVAASPPSIIAAFPSAYPMSKKPRPQPPRPQAAQLDGVRRQARQDNFAEARKRLDELIARFPDHGPLYALAWEIEDEAGHHHHACARAWDWSRHAPNSRAAWEALRESALAFKSYAIAVRAGLRLDRLAGLAGNEPPPAETLFGPLTLDESVTVDLAGVFLNCRRYRQGLAVLADSDHPIVLNNRGMLALADGNIGAALSTLEAAWRANPRNLVALQRVILLHLWQYGPEGVGSLPDELRRVAPARLDDALAQAGALLILGRLDAAEAAWRAAEAADLFETNSGRNRPRFHAVGAMIALRLGRLDSARRRLESARGSADETETETIRQAMAALVRGAPTEVDLGIGDVALWLPMRWHDDLIALARKHDEAAFERHTLTCSASAAYLGLACEFGGAHVRAVAMMPLRSRAKTGDPAAIAELRGLLARPCGPDSVRHEIRAFLQDRRLIESGAELDILLNGEVTRLVPLNVRLSAEPRPPTLPLEDQERFYQASLHNRTGRHEEGRALLEALRLKHPDSAMIAFNLAGMVESTEGTFAAAEPLYHRAAEIDPNYFFGQVGLTRCALHRGETKRAKDMLASLMRREEFHYSEWRALLAVRMEIAGIEGDTSAAEQLRQAIAEIDREFAVG